MDVVFVPGRREFEDANSLKMKSLKEEPPGCSNGKVAINRDVGTDVVCPSVDV
jgi:hypothetical protein